MIVDDRKVKNRRKYKFRMKQRRDCGKDFISTFLFCFGSCSIFWFTVTKNFVIHLYFYSKTYLVSRRSPNVFTRTSHTPQMEKDESRGSTTKSRIEQTRPVQRLYWWVILLVTLWTQLRFTEKFFKKFSILE